MRLVTDGTLGDRDARHIGRATDQRPCRLAILASMALGMSDGIDDWRAKIARAETEQLWAYDLGRAVPAYVVRAFREALERAAARPASDFGTSSHVR